MLSVYASPLTDLRELTALLEAYGQPWQRHELSMGSAEQREQYRALKAQYDWPTLPLITDDRGLIGGIDELRAHLSRQASAPPLAIAAGLGGLIPFIALAALLLAGVDAAPISLATALLAYAACILSFVGAIQWGLALAAPEPAGRRYAVSVAPALAGWLVLSLPLASSQQALLFAGAFAGWYAFERLTLWQDYPDWFRQLRRLLTGVVAATLAAVGVFS